MTPHADKKVVIIGGSVGLGLATARSSTAVQEQLECGQ